MFGELALLYNCKRTATVITKTNVSLWALEREIFQHIVRSAGEERDKERLNLLSKVKDLKSLPDEKMRKIVDCLEEEEYEDNECILRQVKVQIDLIDPSCTTAPSAVTRRCEEHEIVCYFNGFIKNFEKGAAGDLFYIIRSGSVRITKNNENFHYGNLVTNVTPREDDEFAFDTGNDTDLLPEIEVATLNSGDYFGECALLKEDKGCF